MPVPVVASGRGFVRIEWVDVLDGVEGVWTEEPSAVGSAWRDEEAGEWDLFMWQDGNYGCDCNRGAFFRPGATDESCGAARFRIVKIWVRPAVGGEYELQPYSEHRGILVVPDWKNQ